jgi:hypothetical protein
MGIFFIGNWILENGITVQGSIQPGSRSKSGLNGFETGIVQIRQACCHVRHSGRARLRRASLGRNDGY